MRSRKYRGLCGLILAVALFALPSTAQAADYNFETQAPSDYYGSTSYEDIYGSRYNYGGPNVVDYQVPELEYGVLSSTQTGIMEKALLPGLQQTVATGTGGYGISGGGAAVTLPGISDGESFLPGLPAYTQLTDDFLLSNGAIGKISIPAIGVKNYYLWEGGHKLQHEQGPGPLRHHQCLGWQCGPVRTQPRREVHHRRHQGHGRGGQGDLHHLRRHPHL